MVLFLIGMITAVAAPRFRRLIFENSLKKDSRRLIGLINRTGARAATEQKSYQLWFHMSENRIRVNLGEDKEMSLTLSDDVDLVDITIHEPGNPGGNRIAGGEAAVLFSSRGYVTRTLIHLRDDDGDELSIYLSPFLGVTRVFDSAVDFRDEQLL